MAVSDLDDGGASIWLGYEFIMKANLVIPRIASTVWDGLDEALGKSQIADDPLVAARHAVRGWWNHFGPAFASYTQAERKPTYAKFRQLLKVRGLAESIPPKKLYDLWQQAAAIWTGVSQGPPVAGNIAAQNQTA